MNIPANANTRIGLVVNSTFHQRTNHITNMINHMHTVERDKSLWTNKFCCRQNHLVSRQPKEIGLQSTTVTSEGSWRNLSLHQLETSLKFNSIELKKIV